MLNSVYAWRCEYRVDISALKKWCVIQIVGIIYSIYQLELRSKTEFETPLPQNSLEFCDTFQLFD